MIDHREVLARLVVAAEDGRLASLCKRHGAWILGAHGSAVAGDHPARDLDLAVLLPPPATLDNLVALTDDLRELVGGGEIDLMDLRHATPVARTHGLGGIPLYEDRRGRFAEEAIAAWSERLDTSWLRRLERELLTG
ncbi:MAG: nucleotidyltransferase family protein [Euzebya sp.]